MTQPIRHDDIIWIKVPEGMIFCEVHSYSNKKRPQTLQCNGKMQIPFQHTDLPPGQYEFVSLHSTMTEEKARDVVVRWGYRHLPIWKDYTDPKDWMATALESYHSLTRSLNMGSGEWAVLKQVK